MPNRRAVSPNVVLVRALLVVGALLLSGCGDNAPAEARAAAQLCQATSSHVEEGTASWYGKGDGFHGRQTANGEIYDMNGLTAAHPELPFGSKVRVTNLDNGRSVLLVINDRGPYADDRIVDVSYYAAKRLDFVEDGLAEVRIETVESC